MNEDTMIDTFGDAEADEAYWAEIDGDDVDYDPWNEIDQGMWDDDPNPYHGDYSEM